MRAPVRPELRLVPLAGTRAAFTGRGHGNVSLLLGGGDPVAARRALGPLVDAEPGATVFMRQVHGSAAARVGAAERGRGIDDQAAALRDVDALVTTEPGLPLAVLTADCVPVLLARDGAVGAAHAGREGLVAGVLESALDALAPLGAGEVTAVVGPAVGPCCYEVPGELATETARRVPAAEARTAWGTPALDLPGAAVATLRRAGVARVARVRACTRCDPATWFSHRAVTDGRTPRGVQGRQASVIALTEGGRSDGDDLRWPVEWLS